MRQLIFILLLICMQRIIGYSQNFTKFYTVQSLHKYYRNYRFGVYENQRKTAKIVKEELFIGNKLRQIEAWIQVKGLRYIRISIPRNKMGFYL